MDKRIEQILENIARQHLTLESLKTQNSGEDFQVQSVWCIKKALEVAYQQGLKDGQQQ